MSNDQISSRVSKNSNKHYYMFTPERLEGLEEVPDEKLMLLKFKFDVEAADISVDTVVTLPAKPMHFSVNKNVLLFRYLNGIILHASKLNQSD